MEGDSLLASEGDGLLASEGDGLLASEGDGLLASEGDGLTSLAQPRLCRVGRATRTRPSTQALAGLLP